MSGLPPGGRGAQTGERAIEVLLLITQSEKPMSLSEVSSRAGVNRSAAYRAVRALMRYSLVARDDHGGYVNGSGLVALAGSVIRRVNVRDLAADAMERLNASTGETVSLYVRDRLHRVCVAVIEGHEPMRWVVEVGDRQPLHVGVTGKAILAFLPQSEIDEALDWAEQEGADRGRIEVGLERVRVRGYLADVGDRMPGVAGLSVPIFNSSGIVAALTISGPDSRFTKEFAEESADVVLQECAAISAALGGCVDGGMTTLRRRKRRLGADVKSRSLGGRGDAV